MGVYVNFGLFPDQLIGIKHDRMLLTWRWAVTSRAELNMSNLLVCWIKRVVRSKNDFTDHKTGQNSSVACGYKLTTIVKLFTIAEPVLKFKYTVVSIGNE